MHNQSSTHVLIIKKDRISFLILFVSSNSPNLKYFILN